MDTTEHTENTETNILKWIQYDNKIKEYNEKLKLLRDEKDKISTTMINKISEGGDLPVYNVTNLNTSVAFQKTNVYENYTNKFYKDTFTEFLGSEEKAEDLMKFMKQKRKVEQKINIKRTYIADL